MKVLVLGARGMLGTDLVNQLLTSNHAVVGMSSQEFDVTDPTSAAQLATGSLGEFDAVFNCAAYTKVDLAESEPQKAHEVNALGPGYLAQACVQLGVPLLHISTDFVFDGRANIPYPENAPTRPLGVYGQTKLDGEESVLASGGIVVRTSWLYGAHGPCFPKSIIRAFAAGKELKVVGDQFGCPTFTPDLARALVRLAEKTRLPGLYHVAGPETMSWHEFATRAVTAFAAFASAPRLVSITSIGTQDWPTAAERPKFSALSTGLTDSMGITPLPPVSVSLSQFLAEWKTTEDFPAMESKFSSA